MSKVKLLPHNQLTFEYILELSKNNKKICIPQATGTGKTWLEARILEEWSDKKAMIFAPRNEILDETCATLEDNKITNAETITYQTFNNMSDEDIINMEVDIILFDEAHRILATEWYKKIQILIDSHPNSMVFGLTATPVRPDGRDIREEVFENCSTHYITLGEAIVRDIVKMPIYVSALYTFDEMIEELQNKIKDSKNSKEEKSELKKRLKAAKNNLELSMGVPTIIKKYIEDYNGKYLVFCRDTEHLEESILLVNRWFREAGYEGDIVNYRIGSNYSNSDKQLETFKTYKGDGLKLLFSIEKLNEGVHIPTVDGVILLRPTNSNIIYYQQIGRCIRANTDKRPIILDLVNNTNGIKIPLQDEIEKCIEIRKSGEYFECSQEFEIDNYSIVDYLHETASVFSEIEDDLILNNRPWTKEEDEIIIDNYAQIGSDVIKLLQNRSIVAIRRRANILGVLKIGKWSNEEIDILKQFYSTHQEECFKKINRSKSAIKHKANLLGLKTNVFWSCEDIELLKEKYPIMGTNCFVLFNNRERNSIYVKAKELGLEYETKMWTDEEVSILKKYYPKIGVDCLKMLKNKTKSSIVHKASKLGLHAKRSSQYKYVSLHEKSNKWTVQMQVNGKRKYFGIYDTEDEAGKVAMEKAKEYGKI